MKYPEKIISGGQTEADQGGLEAAKELGIQTGGTAPFGWKTETGPNPKLLRDTYNLISNLSPNYPSRTRANVFNSDGTVIFGNVDEPGSRLTLNLCLRVGKLCIVNPTVESFQEWLECNLQIKVLNVAGNRESKNPGIQEGVRNFLVRALGGGN